MKNQKIQDLLFEVKQLDKIEAASLLNVNLPNQYSTAIYAPDKNKLLHLAGSNYELVTNEELYQKVSGELTAMYGNVWEVDFVNNDDRRFKMDFKLPLENLHEVSVGDKLFAVLSVNNSYDGHLKLSASVGFERLVCSNGLTAYELGNQIALYKHGKAAKVFDFSAIQRAMSVLDLQVNKYKKMQEKFLTYAEISTFVEELGKSQRQRESFPKTLLIDVLPVIEKEASLLNTAPNAWLLYNAFNYHINHNPKVTDDIGIKAKMDSLIYQAIAELV